MILTAVHRAARRAVPWVVLPSLRSCRRLAWPGLALAACGMAPAWAQAPAPAPQPVPTQSTPTQSTPNQVQADPPAEPAAPTRLDPAHSRFGFELRTRLGQRVEGSFPRYEGEVIVLPDGRRRVRIRLATASVEVAGSERYTRFARGDSFLDAARHPWVEFTSEPYVGELVRAGGPLRGTLSLRGVSKPETFTLKPSACPRPAHDCDVVAYGRINRADYGLRTWRWAVQDEIRFTLRVRWLEGAP